jgi:cyclophilin family peptidyl-prolyl cis-trans isomerase
MKRTALLVCCLFALTMPLPSTAQVSGAAVSMTCPDTVDVNDPLGNNNTTYQCTVSNPTAYVENISFEVQSDHLNALTVSYLLVGAGQEEPVDVEVSWDSATQTGAVYVVQLSATVQELNNLPPPNTASSQVNSIVDLDHDQCTTNGSLSTEYIQLQMGDDWGDIVIQLNHSAAPVHANNFALLSTMGCYDGVLFHRVIDDFMIQGGDFTNGDGTGGHAAKFFGYCDGTASETACAGGSTSYTVPDEADNGLLHEVCTISMAKTSAPNTGGSQFFLIPPDSNNGDGPDWLDGVHTVFGEVVHGCDVVQAISDMETGANDKPAEDVVIVQAVPSNVPHHDVDEDGVENDVDNCPNDANADQADEDADGIGDACDDPAADFDQDGIPDSNDPDDDGDGMNDTDDAFPYDASETTDTDGDGIGDNADADDDGDGMNDEDDAFPYDASETTDTDGDGIGDNADADDDGDGVADTTDNCPYVANEGQEDSDGDSIGDACDAEEDETPTVPSVGFVFTALTFLGAAAYLRRD